jgi:cell division transport system ATP-binding protein
LEVPPGSRPAGERPPIIRPVVEPDAVVPVERAGGAPAPAPAAARAPGEAPLVELRNVAVSYTAPDGSRLEVAKDLSVTLRRGEMAYLIGPTGSGKSTLLKLLYMDVRPEFGTVRVGPYHSDRVTPRDIPFLRRSLGVVFQDFQLLPDRSAFENVAFALYATGRSGREVKERTLHALARVGLSHRARARPHELSGGEQQRACIARALVNDPVLLLADEPTGNLDPRVADEIQKLLVRLNRQGTALLMATHDYRVVKAFPARTLALVKGRLMEVDPQSL